MTACPSDDRLARFLAEQLGETEHAPVEAHVNACPKCQARLELLVGQALSIKGEEPPTDLFPSPAQEFITRLKRLGPPLNLHETDGLGGPGLMFPGEPSERGPLGRLGPYHVVRLIGWGATGEVYEAFDETLQRRVALKVLRPHLLQTADGLARFQREARAAATVSNEHVVAVHQILASGDTPAPCIVMEYVAGPNLAERLRDKGCPATREAVRIVRAAALGLADAHERGLVHRDVKLSNLLIEESSGKVKVTDFGLARAVEAASIGGQRLTMSGVILGTPDSMSPEQIVTPERVGPPCDIWALGVILYELLTGVPPFVGSAHHILHQILHDEPRSPSQLNPAIPVALETVTLRCLMKEPNLRYRNAAELAVDLGRWLAGEAVQARRFGWTRRLQRWGRRHPVTAVVSGLAAAAFLACAVVAALFVAASFHSDRLLRQHQEQTAAAEQETRRWQALAALDRGQILCERGDAAQGLLWFARALELAPDDASGLGRCARVQIAAWSHRVHQLREVLGDDTAVTSVGFGPAGNTILSASEGGQTRIWNREGRLLRSRAHNGPVPGAVFTPDGRTVLVCKVGNARLWRPESNEISNPLWDLKQELLRSALVMPDGREVLTVAEDGSVRRWRIDDASMVEIAGSLPRDTRGLGLSPDGRILATAGPGTVARLWDLAAGRFTGVELTHEEAVTAAVFAPHGKTLATASKDHTARLWDAATGQARAGPFRHRDKVYSIAFSPNGSIILTGSKDRTARLWDAATGHPFGSPCSHPGLVSSVAFAPDGRTFLTGCADGGTRLWDVAVEPVLELSIGWKRRVTSATFHPSKARSSFALGGPEERAGFWKTEAGWEGATYQQTAVQFSQIAFSPDGLKFLANAGEIVQLADAQTGELLPVTLSHGAAVRAFAWSPDSRTVVTGCEDGRARVWDSATGQLLGTTPLHGGAVTAVAFSPDGRMFATGCWDGVAGLWLTETRKPLGDLLLHTAGIMALAFSPDGRRLLTASHDSTAQIWNLDTLQPVGPSLTHEQPLSAAVISADGHIAATGSTDHSARLWDVATGRSLGPSRDHGEAVSAVAFSPDGKSLLVAGSRERVQFWRVPGPVKGGVEQVVADVERLTGLKLTADGLVKPLSIAEWQRHRR